MSSIDHDKFQSSYQAVDLPYLGSVSELTKGIYNCSLPSLERLVCFNTYRQKMWLGLMGFLPWAILQHKFSYAYVGGGFLSDKAKPRDIDLVLETRSAYGPEAFAAVSRFFACGLERFEYLYGVHLQFWMKGAPPGFSDYRTFFQYNKPKPRQPFDLSRGIVRLDLLDEKLVGQIRQQIFLDPPSGGEQTLHAGPDIDPKDQAAHRLVEAVQQLSQADSLEEIIEVVRTSTRRLLNADGAALVLREGDKCHHVTEDAISPLLKGQSFEVAACASGWTMVHKKPAAVPDIRKENEIPLDAYKPTFVKSLLMVPVCADEPIGAVGIYWAEKHVATTAEIELIQALANAIGVALKSVQTRTLLSLRASEHRRQLDEVNRELQVFAEALSSDLRKVLDPIRSNRKRLPRSPDR